MLTIAQCCILNATQRVSDNCFALRRGVSQLVQRMVQLCNGVSQPVQRMLHYTMGSAGSFMGSAGSPWGFLEFYHNSLNK